MLQAKVRGDSPLKSVTACSGIQFNPRDWIEIPRGFEDEALNYPFLETRFILPEEGQPQTTESDLPVGMAAPSSASEDLPPKKKANTPKKAQPAGEVEAQP